MIPPANKNDLVDIDGERRSVAIPVIPARRSPTAWLILIAVVAVGLSSDLITKTLAFESVAGAPVVLDRSSAIENPGYAPIPPHDGVQVLPGNLLDLRLVLNSGAVFGIGAHQRWFFVCFSFVAIAVALWIFGWRTSSRHHLLHIAIGCILAGALGNLTDRLMLGRVRDMLHMLPGWHLPFGMTWPGGNPEVWPWIFNIADVLLLTGMAMVMIDTWNRGRIERQTTSSEPAE